MKKIILLIACLAVSACNNVENSKRVLTASGYSDVTMTGFRWTGCGKEDSFHDGFSAKGPTGVPVSGIVCSGASPFGKSSTIRID